MIIIKLNTIYNCDCVPAIRSIPDESVDLIITDPPYGIKYKSNWSKIEKFEMLKNDDNNSRFKAYEQFYRVLKNNSVCIVFSSYKNYADDYNVLRNLFDIKNVLIWYKRGGGLVI